MTKVAIHSARAGEAEQILKLQYLCCQSEAALYDDYSMPPLTQTLWELLEEYDAGEVLVARFEEEVVGSVRGRLKAGTCHIGMLVVHPRLQGKGVGTRLMRAIEERFAEAERYELSVEHLSEGNLRLYHRLGYLEFREHTVSPRLRVIHVRRSRESKTSG